MCAIKMPLESLEVKLASLPATIRIVTFTYHQINLFYLSTPLQMTYSIINQFFYSVYIRMLLSVATRTYHHHVAADDHATDQS